MTSRERWKLGPVQLFRWGVATALLLASGYLFARVGGGVAVGVILNFAPFIVVTIGFAIGAGAFQRREIRDLVASGCGEQDAKQRVKRNMWGGMAVAHTAGALCLMAAPSLASAMSGGRMGGLMSPIMGSGLLVMAIVAAWVAVVRGRLVGVGPHCRKCGYPVASDAVHQCPECGVPIVTFSDIRDGRIEHPAWILSLAVAVTLGAAALLTPVGSRLFFSRGVGVLPTSVVIGVATGPDMFDARRAWDELKTRTLSVQGQRELMNAVLVRWETDGALPSLVEQDMAGFIEAELIAGRMAPDQVGRLTALSVYMPGQIFAKKLLSALRSVPLSGEQQSALTHGVIELVRKQRYLGLQDADAAWLFNRLAKGELTEVQRRECVDIVKDALAGSGIVSAGVVTSVILSTADQDIRSQLLDLMVAAAEERPGSVLLSIQRDLFNHAIVEGWLSDEQAAFVLQHEISSFAILPPDLLDALDNHQRDNAIGALLAAMVDDASLVLAADPRKWSWLLEQRLHDRVTPEQARTIDEIAERLDDHPFSPEPTP